MSDVYLARDVRLGRRVALKVIGRQSFSSPAAVESFLREAELTASFNHRHIVTVYAAGELQGSPYLALEFLDGETLRQRLEREALPRTEALHHALAISEALAEAHSRGVLHLDLKAENVMIPWDGRLRVLDFGVACRISDDQQAIEPASVSSATANPGPMGTFPSGLRGTPSYMAPELWLAEPATSASDVWALGTLIYELVSGRRPFRARSIWELGRQVIAAEHAPLL